MKIKATKNFLKRSKKLLKYNPQIRSQFETTLNILLEDTFDPKLKTHRLSGDLSDFWSCSVTYKIRIRFKIDGEIIELIDVGSHDEVY